MSEERDCPLPLKVTLDGEEWAENNLGELAREIERTQRKLNELIEFVKLLATASRHEK